MKRISILSGITFLVLYFIQMPAQAQYDKITVTNASTNTLQLRQVVETDSTTQLYVQYTCNKEYARLSLNPVENIFVKGRKYPMLQAYNIPLHNDAENLSASVDGLGRKHNFVLEFEKFHIDQPFDWIEGVEGVHTGWMLKGIKVDTSEKTAPFDLKTYIGETPLKLYGEYSKEGKNFAWFMFNDIQLLAHFSKDETYGKYLKVYLDITNKTDSKVTFRIANMEAKGYKQKGQEREYFAMETMSATEYDEKVRKKQSRQNFWHVDEEAENIRRAGTLNTGHSKPKTVLDNIVQIHNGVVNVYADKVARKNNAKFYEAQEKNRERLWNAYIKDNTIEPGGTYGGFYNLVYKKADGVIVTMKINGEEYHYHVGL